MRLLLDEHYSKRIAEQLRVRGHDVVASVEREDLVGLSDVDLLAVASREARALVTENWGDFQRILAEGAIGHHGLVFTSAKRLPRGRSTIGLFVETLATFLDRHPATDALRGSYRWLP